MKINPPSSSSRGLTLLPLRVTCSWESVWCCWPHFLFWECCTGIRNFTTRNPAKSWVSINLFCSVPVHQVSQNHLDLSSSVLRGNSDFLPLWFKLFCSDMCNEKCIHNPIDLDLKEWAISSKKPWSGWEHTWSSLLTAVLPIWECEWVSYTVHTLFTPNLISYPKLLTFGLWAPVTGIGAVYPFKDDYNLSNTSIFHPPLLPHFTRSHWCV